MWDGFRFRKRNYLLAWKKRLADGIISMDPTVYKQWLMELDDKYSIVQCSEYDKDEILSYVTIVNWQLT